MIKYQLNTNTLDLYNVMQQLDTIQKLFKPNIIFEITLSNISHIDSAGIAFLLELKKIAIKINCTILFTEIPQKILVLCKLYDIILT